MATEGVFMLRRFVALITAAVMLPTTLWALGSSKAMYVGGTITAKIPEKTEGTLDTTSREKLIFIADKGKGVAELPYKLIDGFEYGQKASHRIKTALLLTPWSLFSKKRRHYLSFIWKDEEGNDQGVVLELGKDLLRPTVMVLEARTGKKVVFQDEEAQKHFAK
jgi:hypothetical protein